MRSTYAEARVPRCPERVRTYVLVRAARERWHFAMSQAGSVTLAYRYATPSVLLRDELSLATSGGVTEAGPAVHPYFFTGFLAGPGLPRRRSSRPPRSPARGTTRRRARSRCSATPS